MDKVKLTKEQATTIEECKKRLFLLFSQTAAADIVVTAALDRSDSPKLGISLDSLIRALYIGYEVEVSPEEKVRKFYNDLDPNASYGTASRFAVKETLKMLGIKIEGVND
jgi:hypothetical protein